MIDVFLTVNTPIKDVKSALNGFDSNCIQVRNGGDTEIWKRGTNGWEIEQQPGSTFFDKLCDEHIELVAYTLAFGGGFSDEIEGTTLSFTNEESIDFFTHMRKYQYRLEDSIGCSIISSGRSCALSCLYLGEFKRMIDKKASWSQKVIDWVIKVQKLGADEVGIIIPHAKNHRSYKS
ncbi:hypothetical protein IBE33_09310 [Francisella philomiragia]|uniref:hypothetical protein n=1 Tax=Francisella philomiragia TaxID=28110 RepID=UPI001908D7BD|nr:hypothetical protein [Francisella philomiragia]MBK2341707.1 hypothetical protein [Francisella philomiragia]